MTVYTHKVKPSNSAIETTVAPALADDLENPYHLTLSRAAYQDAMSRCPALLTDEANRRLYSFLFLQKTWRDRRNRIILSNKLLARMERKMSAQKSKNYSGLKFLEKFESETGIRIELAPSWYDKERGQGRCRTVTAIRLPEWMVGGVGIGESAFSSEAQVYIDTGTTLSLREIERRWHSDAQRERAQHRQLWHSPQQQVVADALHAVPASFFYHRVQRNKQAAVAVFRTLRDTGQLETGDNTEVHLRHLIGMPKPLYHAVANSERIFSYGLQGIKSEIRRALLPDCYELDLTSAHAAIAASLWPIPDVTRILETGASLWYVLMDGMHIDTGQQEEAKPLVKQALYSLLYGMPAQVAAWTLDDGLKAAGIFASRLITGVAPVPAILEAREKEKARLRRERATVTPCGTLKLADTDFRTIKSHMCHAISAYELDLLVPAYETVARWQSATIVLHQHDGLTLHVRASHADKCIAAIGQAVRKRASEHGIATRLAVSYAPVGTLF